MKMNDSKPLPDDPRLTAYALGELEPNERAEVEELLETNPSARAAVAEIQTVARQLSKALANEPMVSSSAKPSASPPVRSTVRRRTAPKVASFPYYWVAGLAAACIAVLIVFNGSAPRPDEKRPHRKGEVYAVNLKNNEVPTETEKPAEPAAASSSLAATEPASEPVVPPAPVAVATAAPEKVEKKPEAAFTLKLAPTETAAVPRLAANAPPVEEKQPEPQVAPKAVLRLEPDVKVAEKAEAVVSPTPKEPSKATLLANDTAVAATPKAVEKKLASNNPRRVDPQGAEDTIELSSFSVSTDARHSKRESAGIIGDRRKLSKTEEIRRRASAAEKPLSTESYAFQQDNDFLSVINNRLSTFSIDVDTASYANVRRFIMNGRLPPADAVRIEELVNYFPYRYAPPAFVENVILQKPSSKSADKGSEVARSTDVTPPFAASLEVAAAPWNPAHRLVRIGLKGREVPDADRPPANLVFLLDVSGSMDEPNKLPLVKESLKLLIEKLKPSDRIAIVTYASGSGLALPSTPVSNKREILEALDALHAEGSTNGAMGIQLAYDVARANFLTEGVNRVILCTDGDFNMGVTSEGALVRLIQQKAKSGVYLTALGFGMGNYKDTLLEKLADKGDGNYGYVDTQAEAKKLLVDQLSGTLMTIAKDVKLQVEFNPAMASAYRLIGYEDRTLKKEDFNNDKVDAGEIGAGHTVTALYEVIPVDSDKEKSEPDVDPLKYQPTSAEGPAVASDEKAGSDLSRAATRGELLTLKIRFKPPTVEISRKIEVPLVDTGVAFAAASQDFKFAAAVAGFGMMLRESPEKGSTTYDNVLAWAEGNEGEDASGYRHEFITLVKKAKVLSAE